MKGDDSLLLEYLIFTRDFKRYIFSKYKDSTHTRFCEIYAIILKIYPKYKI